MTREEYYELLVNQAESKSGSVWNSLVSSLVGKELLYYGANVLADVDQVVDMINGVQDLSRVSSLSQVVNFAYTNEVSCDTVRPSTIKIKITGVSVVVAPFYIQLVVGGVVYYNIDFVKTDQEITLYQGSVYSCSSGSTSLVTLPDMASPTTKSWRLYLEFREGKYQSSYVKLSSDAISASVRVYAKSINAAGPVFPYTEYNAALSNPEALLYKVRTGWDFSVNVLFGDSNWAQQVMPSQYNYQIVWLQAGTNRVTLSSSSLLYISGTEWDGSTGSGAIYKSGVKLNSSVYYDVISSSDGEASSIPYARNYVISAVYKSRGIVTNQQVKNFVASFPSVGSVQVLSGDGKVTAYVKPTVVGDTNFGFIQDMLYQYGVSGGYYAVVAASPLHFNVTLRPVSAESSASVLAAQDVVVNTFSYDSLSITDDVSAAIINQTLALNGITGIVSVIAVQESVSVSNGRMQLSATPVLNTIRQYNTNTGALVGFDSDGLFKSIGDLNSLGTSCLVSRVGDFLYLTDGSKFYLLDVQSNRVLAVDASLAFNKSNGVFSMNSGSTTALLYQDSAGDWYVSQYAVSASLSSGSASLFYRNSFLQPISTYKVVLSGSLSSLEVDLMGSFFCMGSTAYIALKAEGGSALYRFDLTPSEAGMVYSSYGVSVGPSSNVQGGNAAILNDDIVVPAGGSSLNSDYLSMFYVLRTSTGALYTPTVQVTDTSGQSLQLTGVTSIYFSGSQLYFLVPDKSNNATTLCSALYRFSSDMQNVVLSITSTVSVPAYYIEGTGYIYADRILYADASTLWLLSAQDSNNPVHWRGSLSALQSSESSVVKLLSSFYEFTSVGSVDYNTGVIYGISSSLLIPDTVEYEVSGSLMRDGFYPDLVDVFVED